MERLSIDFKRPLLTTSRNAYILKVVDEYSRFPFAFPCPNMHSSTVIKCLDQIFTLCGMPSYINSDRGTSFLSQEFKEYLSQWGIATSKSTPYHPIGNGQVERYNGIIWKTVRLSLKSKNLPDSQWEVVRPGALHSIRSLLSTSTNSTPHERFFSFQRRSSCGTSMPSWLHSPGPVLLRRFVRTSKNYPLVDQVELRDVNPMYANVRYMDCRESTVSLRDLAPCPSVPMDATKYSQADVQYSETVEANAPILTPDAHPDPEPCSPTPMRESRHSTREIKPPSRYGWWLVSSRLEDNDINFELTVSSDNSSRKEELRKTLRYKCSATFLLGRKNDRNIEFTNYVWHFFHFVSRSLVMSTWLLSWIKPNIEGYNTVYWREKDKPPRPFGWTSFLTDSLNYSATTKSLKREPDTNYQIWVAHA